MAPTRGGCCRALHLREENARFALLGVVMILYMVVGATLFHLLEAGTEQEARDQYARALSTFWEKYNGTVDPRDLEVLLQEHGNASAHNLLPGKRLRWDFSGSFYFVGTVVSTIGFGMTTPMTSAGRALVVAYGFFGCSGAILFFNLFLERIITFLAYVLRACHERELRRRGLLDRRESQLSFDDRLDDWKPSVYWVMLYLCLATVVIAVSASALYSVTEQWSYFESLYFCFIAFSTIGFGDFVPNQRAHYPHMDTSSTAYSTPPADPSNCSTTAMENILRVNDTEEENASTFRKEFQMNWYRVTNFVILVVGCCCIYSLFNVTSIVIKQVLNWLIKKLDCSCKLRRYKTPHLDKPSRFRRNALTPAHLRDQARAAAAACGKRPTSTSAGAGSDADSTYDSDDERGHSGELICMSDLLRANKVSLAVMQKQLYETAQRGGHGPILLPSRVHENQDSFKPGTVGPLAIVSQKFGNEQS
ncbi:potassium channel subfamily K member 13-like [Ornithodoros turicata]|uniref:potassium channel subfamily K member 13-like n=1 Tax=Ornithodoros turicata TaxID=34597 RepID=UPI003138DFA8